MTISDKQHIAKILFTQQKLEQKIIAKKIDVSEKTISNWVEKFQWKKLRNRLLVSKQEVLGNLYEQLEELNNDIRSRDNGKRYADSKEADTMVKYTASIRNLETDLAIADIVDSGIRFIRFIQVKLPAKEVINIADLWNDFLHEQIKNKG
jgi:transposase